MSMIFAAYISGSCNNCKKDLSVMDKTPAFIITPYEELPNADFLLCEECARKIKNDYTVERYFKLVDEAKAKEKGK